MSMVRPVSCSGSVETVSPRSTCWKMPGALSLYQRLARHLSLTVRASAGFFAEVSFSAIGVGPPTGDSYLNLPAAPAAHRRPEPFPDSCRPKAN